MLIILNLPLVGMWAKVLQIPRPYLYAGILVFAGLGAYAANFTIFDIGVLLLGIIGFFMRRHGYPVAPMVVGAILGPMAEEQLRKAMAISQGDPIALVQSPVSIVIYSAMLVIIALGIWLKHRQARFEADLAEVDTATIRTVDEEIAEQLRER